MQDYFNYDIFYCMNITDIDDKVHFQILSDCKNYANRHEAVISSFHETIVVERKLAGL